MVVLDSDNVLKIHLLHLSSTLICEAVKVIKDLMKQTYYSVISVTDYKIN